MWFSRAQKRLTFYHRRAELHQLCLVYWEFVRYQKHIALSERVSSQAGQLRSLVRYEEGN